MKKIIATLLDVTDIEFSFLQEMFNRHYKCQNYKGGTDKLIQRSISQQTDSPDKLGDNLAIKFTSQQTDAQNEPKSGTNLENTETKHQNTAILTIKEKISGSIRRNRKTIKQKNSSPAKNETTENIYFKIPSSPLVIQRDLSPNTSYLLCHRPNMSRKYIFCLYKQIPILDIQAIYDLLQENIFKYTELTIFFSQYKIEPLHGLTFFMEENDEEIANYLYFLGAIRVNTVNIATDFYISSRDDGEITKLGTHNENSDVIKDKNILHKNTKRVDSKKIYTNDWKIYQKYEQHYYMAHSINEPGQNTAIKPFISDQEEMKSHFTDTEKIKSGNFDLEEIHRNEKKLDEEKSFGDKKSKDKTNGDTINRNEIDRNEMKVEKMDANENDKNGYFDDSDWSIIPSNRSTILNHTTTDSHSLNDAPIFKNKLFYFLPSIPQMFHPFLIGLILENGGIRTKRDTRNVDYRVGFISVVNTVPLQKENVSQPFYMDQNSSFISLSFIFKCISKGALFSPHTFCLRPVSIKRPLRDVTALIKHDSNKKMRTNPEEDHTINPFSENWVSEAQKGKVPSESIQGSGNCSDIGYDRHGLLEYVNKLIIMGARIKSRFDSSVTHILSSKPILPSYLNSSSTQDGIFSNRNQTKTACNFVNMQWIDKCLKTRCLVQNKVNWRRSSISGVSYDTEKGSREKLKYPRVCFSNTPKSLKARLTAHLANFQIHVCPIEDADYLIIGNMTLCEKILMAMVSDIKVIRACEYKILSHLDNKDMSQERDENSPPCSPLMLHRTLSAYAYSLDNVQSEKHQKIVKALEYWRGKKPFNNWRVWIVRSTSENRDQIDKENIENKTVNTHIMKNKDHKQNIENKTVNTRVPHIMKNEFKLLLQHIIIKGGGKYSYSNKNFSYTHKVLEEEGLNWIIKHLMACNKQNNKCNL